MSLSSSIKTFTFMLRRRPMQALDLLQLRVERRLGLPLYLLSPSRMATLIFELLNTKPVNERLVPYGNYVLDADRLPANPVAFSLGVGHTLDDIAFDLALLERHPDVKLFLVDPTPISRRFIENAALPANARFIPVAVTDVDGPVDLFVGGLESDPHTASTVSILHQGFHDTSFRVDGKRMSTLMNEHNVTHLDVLKMDIEGAGIEVLSGVLRDGVRPTQIACEFERPSGARQLVEYLQKLSTLFATLEEGGYEIFRTRPQDKGFQVEILAVLAENATRVVRPEEAPRETPKVD